MQIPPHKKHTAAISRCALAWLEVTSAAVSQVHLRPGDPNMHQMSSGWLLDHPRCLKGLKQSFSSHAPAPRPGFSTSLESFFSSLAETLDPEDVESRMFFLMALA